MRLGRVIVLVGCMPAICWFAAAEQRARFEVASVKPDLSGDLRRTEVQFLPGGRFVARGVSPFLLIAVAYDLPFQSPRLSGGPDWIRSERFDIEAGAEAGAVPASLPVKAREDRVRRMLQSLLDERFHLTMRREAREQPVYALVIGKGGPRLARSKMTEEECVGGMSGMFGGAVCHGVSGGQGRGLHGEAVSIADVALYVQNWAERPVVDRTGLKGLYNIQTEGWMPMRQRPPGPDGTPPPAEAGLNDPDRQTLQRVFEQLGLRMESQRAVVEMFVVESAERAAGN